MSIGERIVNIANAYLINHNFSESDSYNSYWLRQKKELCGWNDVYSIHSFFTEAVWREAYAGDHMTVEQLDKLFSPSPISTHTNFRGSKYYRTGAYPQLGALAIWRNGWHSYVGIVVTVAPDGNLFDMVIAELRNNRVWVNHHYSRAANMDYKKDGFNLVGFVYPKEVD